MVKNLREEERDRVKLEQALRGARDGAADAERAALGWRPRVEVVLRDQGWFSGKAERAENLTGPIERPVPA